MGNELKKKKMTNFASQQVSGADKTIKGRREEINSECGQIRQFVPNGQEAI